MMLRRIVPISVFVLLVSSCCFAQKFLPDDPVTIDDDKVPGPKPAEVIQSELYDFGLNSFGDPGKSKDQPAGNVNTLGDVPDSTWFTNRIGIRQMSIEEVVRGANGGNGPDLTEPWNVTKLKTQGAQAGFTIRDSNGGTYFIKFDPVGHPQLGTSADVIASKFFYAFGYNVSENYLVRIHRSDVRPGLNAQMTDENGRKRSLTDKDLNRMFRGAPSLPDDSYQVVASLLIPGEAVGSFLYYGTRSDDPNDVVPHEDRRELRGLRVFSAWLQDFDRRSANSKDMYVKEGGYLKHYLLDFGSTLGSGGVPPINRRLGHEYKIELPNILKASATFGIWDRDWRHYKYPKYAGIGTIESEHFQPQSWKPGYPNPAFSRMQNTDAFWAARIVFRFTDEMIRALVSTGEYIEPHAGEYLTDTLIKRRDRIAAYYFAQVNPLDDFRVEADSLEFKNLGIQAGLATSATYDYQWFRFDNDTLKQDALTPTQSASSTSIKLPEESYPYVMVRIKTIARERPNWSKDVDVYIRTATRTVVGIDRQN